MEVTKSKIIATISTFKGASFSSKVARSSSTLILFADILTQKWQLGRLTRQKSKILKIRLECRTKKNRGHLVSPPLSITFSLPRRRNLTTARRLRGSAAVLVLVGPQRIQWINGSMFIISLQTDRQINNGFFNRPAIARSQIAVNGCGAGSQTDLHQTFSFVCGTG